MEMPLIVKYGITQRIHAWNIYLHENHKNNNQNQPNVGRYTIHGTYGSWNYGVWR